MSTSSWFVSGFASLQPALLALAPVRRERGLWGPRRQRVLGRAMRVVPSLIQLLSAAVRGEGVGPASDLMSLTQPRGQLLSAAKLKTSLQFRS